MRANQGLDLLATTGLKRLVGHNNPTLRIENYDSASDRIECVFYSTWNGVPGVHHGQRTTQQHAKHRQIQSQRHQEGFAELPQSRLCQVVGVTRLQIAPLASSAGDRYTNMIGSHILAHPFLMLAKLMDDQAVKTHQSQFSHVRIAFHELVHQQLGRSVVLIAEMQRTAHRQLFAATQTVPRLHMDVAHGAIEHEKNQRCG